MTPDHPALERLIARELLAEALALMKPGELAVAALRADGLTPPEIAQLLGITPKTVGKRLQTARTRIIQHIPELRVFLQDRAHAQGTTRDLGLSPRHPDHPLTTAQVAHRLGVTIDTVRIWCAAGRFPHAYKTPANRWRIPPRDL